jgi:hypothetical protein
MKMTATGIVIARARGYLYKGKYPQVVVFATDGLELDKLIRAFGGHSYPHGSGFTWVLSKRTELTEFVKQIKPWLPSCHGFENILLPAATIPVVTDGTH